MGRIGLVVLCVVDVCLGQDIFWNYRGAFAPSSDVRCPQNQYQTVKHERGQQNEFRVYATPDSCQELFTSPPGCAAAP